VVTALQPSQPDWRAARTDTSGPIVIRTELRDAPAPARVRFVAWGAGGKDTVTTGDFAADSAAAWLDDVARLSATAPHPGDTRQLGSTVAIRATMAGATPAFGVFFAEEMTDRAVGVALRAPQLHALVVAMRSAIPAGTQ